MRRLLKLNLLVSLLVAIIISAPGQNIEKGKHSIPQTVPQSIPKDRFFPIDKVKPGMRATGYTVFVGSEPKPFELEILGVLKGFPNPRQSAVLAKLIGEEVSHTGVFQGMS